MSVDDTLSNFFDEDENELVAVRGRLKRDGIFETITFSFIKGHLVLQPVDETDEIDVSLTTNPPDLPSVEDHLLADLVGKQVLYAWEMMNHRGYTDAFQLQLVSPGQPDAIRQFEVRASTIYVSRVEYQ